MPLPPEPELEVIHTRTYDIKAYRKDANTLLLRGIVQDQKPGGTYIVDDPEPLTVHHMVVDLEVSYPSTEIVGVNVVFEDHPHSSCPEIVPDYEKIIGLSISHGFTHKIRELFGGPRGCTHILALLQAMAPVTNQVRFTMMMPAAGSGSEANRNSDPMKQMRKLAPEQRLAAMRFNLNTCHVWDEEGEHVQEIREGSRHRGAGLDHQTFRETWSRRLDLATIRGIALSIERRTSAARQCFSQAIPSRSRSRFFDCAL